MLADVVSLYDVRDAEGIVQATLRASRRIYSAEEQEELVAEGLAILCRLADDFDGRGRFSGFAAKFLPLKLEDAYHRLHPEHVLRTQLDGSRRYVSGERPVSLQAMTSEDGEDRARLLATSDDQERELVDLEHGFRAALGPYEVDRELTVRVGLLFARGFSDWRVAWLLDRPREDIRTCKERLHRIMPELGLARGQLSLF
jgi:hypothetical protein